MRTTRWAGRAQIVTLSVVLLGIGGGCRQLGVRNKVPPTPEPAVSPTPIHESAPLPPDTATDPRIPPLPGAEARLRGHSQPKGWTVPVGLSDDEAVRLTEGAEDTDRTEFSDDADNAEPLDLPIPAEADGLVPMPPDELEGPIADAIDSTDDDEWPSLAAEIDVAEFLADLNVGAPPKPEMAPLPIIVPRPVPYAARTPVIEDWPRGGFPWQIVVHPAPHLPVPSPSAAATAFPMAPRLAAGNSSWANEPIE